jgi:serine/threonine protein kinase
VNRDGMIGEVESRFEGRYEVRHYLAEGGMQLVFRAVDTTLDREVVVKVPKDGVVDRRFKRAAELSSRLNHPAIAATLDYFEDDEFTFVVEEFVAGLNLRDLLRRDYEFMDPWLAANVIHQLARGIEVAHSLGVMHRDIKPSNIVVADTPSLDTVKLTDFGIAKLASAQIEFELDEFQRDTSTITGSQTLLGAFPYMAPEALQKWTGAGMPADIWALGALAYELIAGDPPFGSGVPSVVRILQYAAGQVELNRPKEFGDAACSAGVADQLWLVVGRMLDPDPDRRPTAAELLRLCGEISYGTSQRFHGSISMFPSPYGHPYGKVAGSDREFFFHRDEYFGRARPAPGQRVSFSSYPGSPNERCQPVLALRPLTP